MRVLMVSGNREEVDMRVPPLGPACVAAAEKRMACHKNRIDLGRKTTTGASVPLG
jgi:hypothetical protein